MIAIVAVLIGIVLAAAIQQLTGYFTETDRKPVDDVAKSSLTGPATVILSGISVGLESAVYTALLIGAAVYGAFLLGGGSVTLSLFAIALAGTGLLTTVGVIVVDGHLRPGLRQRPGHRRDVRRRRRRRRAGPHRARRGRQHDQGHHQGHRDRDRRARRDRRCSAPFRDAVGTVVTGGRARQCSVSRTAQYAGILDIGNPRNLVGLLIGAAVVFLFSGLAINAVTRAAGAIVFEVRRQFREHPGIMDYTEKPEYGKVVDICTRDSLRELATPGLLAVLAPIAVGFGLGIGALGAYLAGAIATGTLMAVFLANSGGAWDNAKKIVEDGDYGGKGSEAHEATVIGDTVGDPFKDTAGPAINPLIKVMNLVVAARRPGRRLDDARRQDGPAPAHCVRGRSHRHHLGRDLQAPSDRGR